MPANITYLKNQIKAITTLDGVFDFLQNNDVELKKWDKKSHDYIMALLDTKQKELQTSQQTKC